MANTIRDDISIIMEEQENENKEELTVFEFPFPEGTYSVQSSDFSFTLSTKVFGTPKV